MANEIEVFYDKELKNKIDNIVSFEPIKSGEKTIKELYVKNNLEWVTNLDISLEGEYVTLISDLKQVNPKSVGVLTLSLEPPITLLKPIKVKIKIKSTYIIK